MKRLFWVILAIFFVSAGAEAHRPHGGAKFGLFYGSLSPHGEWIEMSFGTVWRPHHVGRQWRPYMKGRWMWTDHGWYWNSYEPFGWATYHYGRWIYDDYYGWIWVPDDVWGPAWVEWRYDDDYIGWAPLPPYAHFSISVGITFGRDWYAPVHYWNFVPCGNFSSVHVVNYIQGPDVTRRIYGRTRNGGHVRTVDRRIVNDGIGLDRVERRSNERIRKVEIVDRNQPGGDRIVRRDNRERLEVFRPGPDEVRRERDGQRSRETTRDLRDAQRGAQRSQIERERGNIERRRSGQRPEADRDARRPKVEPRQQRIERPKPEVDRDRRESQRPNVERKRPEVRRDGGRQERTQPRQNQGRRGRDG